MKFTNKIAVCILVIGAILIGCATNKNANNTDMLISASGTSDGILLNFSNIPEDTYSLSISFIDTMANDDKSEFLETTIYIWDKDLMELRESGYLHCPFAKNAHEYTVTVTVITNDDFRNDFETKDYANFSLNTIAGDGIYMTNNPSLYFTDEDKTVTLSEVPVFSKEVIFSPNGPYQFTNFVMMEDGNSYGGGISYWDELNYPAREVLNGTQEYFGFTGDYPVNASVSCVLVYDDLEWSVGIAKAERNAIMSF